MYKITIIGLGVDEGDISASCLEIIKNSKTVIARTENTISFKQVSTIKTDIKTLDYVYEKSRNFDTLNKNLATEVITLSKSQDVCYLVDGSAMEDNSVKYILSKCKNVSVYSGVSAVHKCLERLKICSSNINSLSAYEVDEKRNISLPLVVYAIDSVILASDVKLKLMELFGEEIDVYVSSNNYAKKIKLFELDRLKIFDYSTSLYIPEIELTKKQRFNFNDLMSILEVLRSENGCPWDREQTEKTILKNVIEEAYELVDAVNQGDDSMIIEETGDLVLQSAFYMLFGEEDCRYTRTDVLSDVCSKLISRHSHVFGSDTASASEDALSVWNKNKITEKGFETVSEYLSAVPMAMPALMRAEKVGKRASKYNFDFDCALSAIQKLYEEILEVKTAITNGSKEEVQKECGDLLFSAVNVLRLLGVDSELALQNSTQKFITRFTKMEEVVLSKNKTLTDLTVKELDDIYNQVKTGENNDN